MTWAILLGLVSVGVVYMPVAVRTEVEVILNGFTGRIRTVLDRAMEDWAAFPNKAWLLWPRDKANIVFSYIARRALEEFAGDPDIHVMSESQTVKFCSGMLF